jgi:hypothetical protein
MPTCCDLVHPVHPADGPPAASVLAGQAVVCDPQHRVTRTRSDAVAAALLAWCTGLVVTAAAVTVVAVNVPLLELVARLAG